MLFRSRRATIGAVVQQKMMLHLAYCLSDDLLGDFYFLPHMPNFISVTMFQFLLLITFIFWKQNREMVNRLMKGNCLCGQKPFFGYFFLFIFSVDRVTSTATITYVRF